MKVHSIQTPPGLGQRASPLRTAMGLPLSVLGLGVLAGLCFGVAGLTGSAALMWLLASWLVVREAQKPAARWQAWWLGMGLVASWTLGSLAWPALAVRNGGENYLLWRAAVLGAVVLHSALLLGLAWGGVLVAKRDSRWRAVDWGLAWSAYEALKELGPVGHGYGSLGLSLAAWPGAECWLPWLGAYGGGVIFAVGFPLGLLELAPWLVRAVRAGGGVTPTVAWATLSVLALILFLGLWRWGRGHEEASKRLSGHARGAVPVHALLTQIDHGAGGGMRRNQQVAAQLSRAINEAPAGSLLVTPEGVLTLPQRSTNEYGPWKTVMDAIRRRKGELAVFVGASVLAREEQGVLHKVNTMMRLDLDPPSVYGKELPVPGGEYLPAPWLFGSIYRHILHGRTERTWPAPEAWLEPLYAQGEHFGVAICHEMTSGRLVAERARHSGILLNPSDDYWIKSESYQRQMIHLARVRAMETARPLLRVSNAGPSLIVTPDGHSVALAATSKDVPVVHVPIEPHHELTVYVRMAQRLSVGVIGLFLAWTAGALWARARQMKRARAPLC